jgi:hypothetical protein
MVVVGMCGAGRNLFLLRTLRRFVGAVAVVGMQWEEVKKPFSGV